MGKSTVARMLAQRTAAHWIRVDTIEQALRDDRPGVDVAGTGYLVAARLATDTLRIGQNAITDCVNPWSETRAMFRDAAARAGARCLEVEILCSDPAQHRHRVESRRPDIPGHTLPAWTDVLARDYRPWPGADLRLDTATLSPDEAASRIAAVSRPDLRAGRLCRRGSRAGGGSVPSSPTAIPHRRATPTGHAAGLRQEGPVPHSPLAPPRPVHYHRPRSVTRFRVPSGGCKCRFW